MNDQKVKIVFQTTPISICFQNKFDLDRIHIAIMSRTSYLPRVYGIIYVKNVKIN